ncbi:MAG: CRISPR-associated endoribonuclease Cas6 [Tyzzerella sp.]|nr:CRISPR-associated endoribonuclease Cas6 [Tyzzerella sp.]
MIELRLKFELEKPELPKTIEKLMVSFLKASLQNYSQELFEEMYDKSKSIIKPYCFSYYLPGAVFKDEKIVLNENYFTMFFSNADLGQTIHWLNAFKLMKSKQYHMNGNSMILKTVYTQEVPKIKDSEIVVKMMSSLIVRKHNSEDNTDIYYTYDQPEFAEVLKENVDIFLQKLNIPISTDGFSIVPIKGKKVISEAFGRKLDSNIGVYKLTGNSELLNLLLVAGVGVRRSAGHGKFKIIC